MLLAGGLAAAAAPPVVVSRLRPVVGEARSVFVEPDDTLLDIAFREKLGYDALVRLNPDVDPWVPDPGSVVRLPTRFVLPDADPEGVVIDVAAMRLLHFAGGPPEVYAVAVGDAADPTVLGSFRVGAKRVNPVWNVPESIRRKKPQLPAQVPPGPDNPLGSRWITIGRTSYGIHGTNNRWSIGREATHGCVRLYESEMERLFSRVKPGTRIQLVYQPFKWGSDGEWIYLEAHPDRYGQLADPLAAALALPRAQGWHAALDRDRVVRVLEAGAGVPVRMLRAPDPRLLPGVSLEPPPTS